MALVRQTGKIRFQVEADDKRKIYRIKLLIRVDDKLEFIIFSPVLIEELYREMRKVEDEGYKPVRRVFEEAGRW